MTLAGLRRYLTTSDDPLAVLVRRTVRFGRNFTLPIPGWSVRPLVWVFHTLRSTYYFLWRVLVCEPYFRSFCYEYGSGVRTGVFLHWIQGRGRLIVGDNVVVDGKSSFEFTVRYTDHPTLSIGSDSKIGHDCLFVVGKSITIGRHCLIASQVRIFDTGGHAVDPLLRIQGAPAQDHEVRPIVIQDNVWIGSKAIIFPGVQIGEGSIVSSGAVVMTDVPKFTVVAGNPARAVRTLEMSEEDREAYGRRTGG